MAHPIAQEEFSLIQERLNMLSNNAEVELPLIYLTELPLPGSFIIGKNINDTALVLPKRLLKLMKIEQMEAMLAYNLVQIDDNICLRTLVVLIASLLTMSSSAVRWGAVFAGFGNYKDHAPSLFGFLIMGLVAPPAATMIHSVAKQDYDAKAAELCRSPDDLISAIECLEDNNVIGYPHLGFVCLIDPLKETFFESLFSTHPPGKMRMKNHFAKEEIA